MTASAARGLVKASLGGKGLRCCVRMRCEPGVYAAATGGWWAGGAKERRRESLLKRVECLDDETDGGEVEGRRSRSEDGAVAEGELREKGNGLGRGCDWAGEA